ncbi:MAG: hypothetical protein H0T54_07460 [Geodermatophilaceae bacterium]|nr:hypothetical protein [Geodermatophilaceae bacterium]
MICLPLIPSGCTDGQNDTGNAQPTSRVQPSTSTPDAPLTLIPDADPATAAISTSRALYDSSEMVVLAGAGDATSMTLGASAAVALGVPLLVSTPTLAIDVANPVGVELERLSADFVLAIGTVAAQSVASTAGTRTVTVPAAADEVAEAIGMELASADPVPVEGLAAAFADLDRVRQRHSCLPMRL